jgi:nucleotide-binding universal stress UspA family protein
MAVEQQFRGRKMDDQNEFFYQMAIEDFHQARNRAALQNLLARLTGKSIDLLPFDEISRKLKVKGSSDQGLQDIPINAIIGSVGRYVDFTRNFLPRRESDRFRWARVKSIIINPSHTGLEPIEVYKIGDVYFVKDGHHRVSIARQMGATHIQAHVNVVRTRVSLSVDTSPEDLILMEEFAAFLDETHLDEILPNAQLKLTFPGMYKTLKEHISVHRYYLGLEKKREISYEEAARHWYEAVYLPVIEIIRELGLLHEFPGRTETDLYLWVSDHRTFLEKDYGWKVSSRTAAGDLVERISPRFSHIWRRTASRIKDAMLPDQIEKTSSSGSEWFNQATELKRLFTDILVPVNGLDQGWKALEQALLVAKLEGANLHGLHVAAGKDAEFLDNEQKLQQHFDQRCSDMGVTGSLVIEKGEIARQISDRAIISDLVVLSLTHPPGEGIMAKLGSGLRTILHRTPRPVLAVPDQISALDRLLLAYDGSPKGKEALFICAYLSARWKFSLALVTVPEKGRASDATCREAYEYLEKRHVSADMLCVQGDVADVLLQAVQNQKSNLIVMGGYGSSPVMEIVMGSTVDRVLRESTVPVLICQ